VSAEATGAAASAAAPTRATQTVALMLNWL
jgi:hypothetical protein